MTWLQLDVVDSNGPLLGRVTPRLVNLDRVTQIDPWPSSVVAPRPGGLSRLWFAGENTPLIVAHNLGELKGWLS